ncbi:MAG: RNA-binding protein [Candidatus Margulisbacteria bacterium]|jgi:RNA recognition motif-containing protein|nr:RNA-binding protein [Candidatus Margulisiibacteriota bacterium]
MAEKKLYIGGLSYGTTENTLKEGFAQAGNVVSAKVIIDKMTGRSKGFGFVEFSTPEEATKAIELFNEKDFDGRKIKVSEARPQENKPRSGGYNRDGGSRSW